MSWKNQLVLAGFKQLGHELSAISWIYRNQHMTWVYSKLRVKNNFKFRYFNKTREKPNSIYNYSKCEDLRRSTGMRDASNLAERLKWKWNGHVARMDNNRWTHKLTMWDPREDRRNVVRQRTTWADQLKRLAGDQWSRSAKDRVLWKNLEKNINSIGLTHL